MAEFVMKDLLAKAGRSDVVVESAAMHEDAIDCDTHRGTRRKLDEMGIPHPRREAWLLDAEKASEYDLIVGMDRYNMSDLEHLVRPEDRGKLKKLLSFAGLDRDVADPWYTGNFDATYDDVLLGCQALLDRLPSCRNAGRMDG